jgi:hypothetical protein
MRKNNMQYWLCQSFGWGVWGLIIMYFNFVVFADKVTELGGKKELVISLLIFLASGVVSTHLLRLIIKKTNWLRYSFNHILLLFTIGVSSTGLLLYYGSNLIEHKSPYSYDNFVMNKKLEKAKKLESQYGLDTVNYFTAKVQDTTNAKYISDIKK